MPETERSSFETMWAALEPDERYEYAIRSRTPEEFLAQDCLLAIAMLWRNEVCRARALEAYRKAGGWPKNLETAITSLLPALAPFMGHHGLNGKNATPDRKRTQRKRALDIMNTEYQALSYIVEKILPAGCTLLIGKSKDGKSLMAYNLVLAVASGGKALGKFDVMQGKVWYLALEDGERRAKDRLMHQMAQYNVPETALANIDMTLWEAPRLDEGLEQDLIEWIAQPDARLVVIDILEKVRPRRKNNGNVYEQDYNATQNITRIAQESNVAILILHHANKLNPADFRDSASGAMSLIGGVDNVWNLNRMALSPEATLRITGREIREEQDLAMRFQDGYWSVVGNALEVNQSTERKDIVGLLRFNPQGLTPQAIAQELDKSRSTVRSLLRKMAENGTVFQPINGRYALSNSDNEKNT